MAIRVRRRVARCRSLAAVAPRASPARLRARRRRRTAASRRIGANPPGFVEGRVRDPDGRPVAGIGVRGIPRGADDPVVAAGDDGVRRDLPPVARRARRTTGSC